MENGLAEFIAKGHMVKPHIPMQTNQGSLWPGGIPPGPKAGFLRTGGQGAISFLADIYQLHRACVFFRRLLHSFENALCAGQGGQQKIALLGQLVDWHGRLTDKHQVAGQASKVGPA